MTNEAAPRTLTTLPAFLGALVGVGVGIVYGLLGFFVVRVLETPRMGGIMFLLLPLVIGATIAMVTPRPIAGISILAGALALAICLISLVSIHAEGILCALLAFPLVFLSLLLGVGIGLLLRSFVREMRSISTNYLVFLAMPVLVLGGEGLQRRAFPQPRIQTIATSIRLQATPDQVWSNIQSLDSLSGEKPFLMHVGLPIPQKCVLQGKAVGSKRTCYFDQGSIEETILAWDPPRRMLLSIDRTNMPGRHWLEFEGAEYDLRAEGDGTIVTRTTTIRSNLSPAWYWGRLESWGVESEHEYLFRDLALRFAAKPKE
ncbi:MAG: SRPBCC family protein [Candidatus Acidiferrum sp.]